MSIDWPGNPCRSASMKRWKIAGAEEILNGKQVYWKRPWWVLIVVCHFSSIQEQLGLPRGKTVQVLWSLWLGLFSVSGEREQAWACKTLGLHSLVLTTSQTHLSVHPIHHYVQPFSAHLENSRKRQKVHWWNGLWSSVLILPLGCGHQCSRICLLLSLEISKWAEKGCTAEGIQRLSNSLGPCTRDCNRSIATQILHGKFQLYRHLGDGCHELRICRDICTDLIITSAMAKYICLLPKSIHPQHAVSK